MSRATQGTVQISRSKGTNEAIVTISPTQNYTIRQLGTDYIIFLQGLSLSASLYSKSSKFLVFDEKLIEILFKASFERICLEIRIEDSGCEVVGVTIPATPSKPSVS